MRRTILISIFLLVATTVFAQSSRVVRGFTYKDDGTPLVGVTIKCVNEEATATSQQGGTFEIKVSPYARFVEAVFDGYISAQAEIDGSLIIFRLKVDKKYAEAKAKAEAERKAAEEAARIAAEKEAIAKAEADRKATEQARIAAEKEAIAKAKAEAERKAAEEKARVAAEKEAAAKAEAERKAAEQARIAAEKEAAAKAKAEAERKAAEERARIAAEKEAAAKAEAERKAAERARIAAEKEALAKAKADAKRKAAEEYARLMAEVKQNNANTSISREEQHQSNKMLKAEERAEHKRLAQEAADRRRMKYAEHQKGFASMVDISYLLELGYPCPYVGVNYTAGYRFNNLFYLGGGVGVNFNIGASPTVATSNCPLYKEDFLNPTLVSVPVFVYFRANFLNRPCSPFFALAAGGSLSAKQTMKLDYCEPKYSTHRLFVNPQVGVNFRTSTKTSLYLAVGFNGFSAPCCVEYKPYNATIKQKFGYGLDFHIGVTF